MIPLGKFPNALIISHRQCQRRKPCRNIGIVGIQQDGRKLVQFSLVGRFKFKLYLGGK